MGKGKIIVALGNGLLVVTVIAFTVIAFNSSSIPEPLNKLMWVAIVIGALEMLIGVTLGMICHFCCCKKNEIGCDQVMPLLMAIPKENRANCTMTIEIKKNENKITITTKSTVK